MSSSTLRACLSMISSVDVIMTILIYFLPKFMIIQNSIIENSILEKKEQHAIQKKPSIMQSSKSIRNLMQAFKLPSKKKVKQQISESNFGGEGVTFFLIDVQNDFYSNSALSSKNGDEDAKQIASFIKKNRYLIDRIIVATQERRKNHISHSSFWVDVEDVNIHPKPFTVIKTSDVGVKWQPRNDLNFDPHGLGCKFYEDNELWDSRGTFNLMNYKKKYTVWLHDEEKYPLTIWPDHCITDTDGSQINSEIQDSLFKWEDSNGKTVKFETRRSHILTEFYSVFEAEYPVNKHSLLNAELFRYILESDKLVIAGSGLCHSLIVTIRDIYEYWPGDMENEMKKIIVLKDYTSPIPMFEDLGVKSGQYLDQIGISFVESTT